MSLTGTQTKAIAESLIDAYNESSLSIMLRTQMDDVRLNTITRSGTFTEVVYGLIDWVDQVGRVQELIEVAHAENPSNAKLAELYADSQKWTYAESSPPARPSATVTHDKIIYNDRVAGDKITTGDLEGTAIAVGAGATAIYQGLTIEEVNSLFAEWREAETVPVWDGRTPYVGLNAFQESDAKFFFGREGLVDDLLARIKSSNFITISGPSGSGKSSVARAGLLHALRLGRLERSDTWLLAPTQPRGNPIEQLALAMARLTQPPTTQRHFLETAASDPQVLSNQAELLLSDDPHQRFVLLADQFEEAFTQTKDEVIRTDFINLLTRTANAENGRTIIVLSLRSDFISHCTRFPELRSLMSKELQLVGAMEPTELAKAIAMPSIKVGAEIEPALVKTVLEDMKGEPGALPLMSFALRELFDAQKTQMGKPVDMTLQEYLDRGGIEKALERHANRVFDEFTPQQQKLAEGIFSRLVEIGQGRVDTRRTAAFAELVPKDVAADEVAAVVQKLAHENTRLVITDGVVGEEIIAGSAADSTTMTLAHERLIDAWPWLRRLVDDNRAMIGLLNQIELDAQRWEQERDEGFLYRGGRVLQVEEMLEQFQPNLNELSTVFIETSQQKRQEAIEREEEIRRRDVENQRRIAEEQRLRAEENEQANANLRRRAVLLTSAGIIALAMAVAAGWFGIDANQQRSVANVQRYSAEGNATQAAFNLSTATVALATSEAAQATAVWNEQDALVARGTALAAQEEAQREARRANAGALAARAQIEIAEDNHANDIALLLARVSVLTTWQREGFVTLEADAVLRSAEGSATWGKTSPLEGHRGPVNSVSWSPDGAQLASASDDNTIRIWDGETLQQKLVLIGHTDRVLSVSWSSDGVQLASTSRDKTIRIWDMETGETLRTLDGHTSLVNSVSWSPDGAQLASASRDTTIRLWDVQTGETLRTLEGHTDMVLSVSWSPDGAQLASGGGRFGNDTTIRLWDVQTGETLRTLEGHTYEVLSVSWSPDGAQLASGSLDTTIRLWDAQRGETLRTLEGHTSSVLSVSWSPDGAQLASASFDNTIRIWNVETWETLRTLDGHTSQVNSVSWSPDGAQLASASDDNTIRIWDVQTGESLRTRTLEGHTDSVNSVSWSPDGAQLASASFDNTIRIWTRDTDLLLALLEARIQRPSWVFTEDERARYGISDELADWLATIPPRPTLTPTPESTSQ